MIRLVDEGCSNSLAWFKKKKQSRDVTNALLQTNLRYSLDKETGERLDYAPRFKVKIPCYDGKFNCDILDSEGNALEGITEDSIETRISKGSKISMTVRPSTLGLLVVNLHFLSRAPLNFVSQKTKLLMLTVLEVMMTKILRLMFLLYLIVMKK